MFKPKIITTIICLSLAVILSSNYWGTGQTVKAQNAANKPSGTGNVTQTMAGLPLLFIENQGQSNADAPFYANAQGQSVFLTKDGIIFDVAKNATDRFVFSLDFQNANQNLIISGAKKDAAVINYLAGNDSANWKTNIPTYQEVLYNDVYPNIDLRLYGDNSQLRYDFIVKPGADISDIELAYNGINTLNIVNGELVAGTSLGDSTQAQPYIYQDINNQKVQVTGGFKILGNKSFGFEANNYDSSQPLIIDPTIAYSTYFGGSGNDSANSVAFGGSSGNVYIGGKTTSAVFPVKNGLLGAYQGGTTDAFVAEIDTNSSGSASLIYCTYLGGSGDDVVNGIGVIPSGAVYLTGSTTSTNFATTTNGYKVTSGGGQDAFLAVLTPGGNGLSYSTYLGGSGTDSGNSIAVDSTTGLAYITGSTASSNFTTLNAYQSALKGTQNAFVVAINPALTGSAGLTYSTYFGGSGIDNGNSITVFNAGTYVLVYFGGDTTSSNFPIKNPYLPGLAFHGSKDGFVASIFPASSGDPSLYYSSVFGGAGNNSVTAVAICPAGCVLATGWTDNNQFPMIVSPYQSYNGGIDGFFIRLHPDGQALVFATYLGGSGDDYPTGIFYNSADASSPTVITGYTTSSNFPTLNATQSALSGLKDAFALRVNPWVLADPGNPTRPYANFMLFSSYLGGSGDDVGRAITIDNHGGILIAGDTTSSNYSNQNAYQSNLQGGTDAFVTRLSGLLASVTTGSATAVTTTSATLNGALTALGTGWSPTGYAAVSFQWGTTPGNYPNVITPAQPDMTAAGAFSATITSGLVAGTTYYYRAAVVGDGTTYGVPNTFTTATGSGAVVNISVVLQGGGRPDAGWIVPLTVKFFSPGANVLTATPLYQFAVTTTKSGTAAIASVTGVPAGTYDVTVVSPGTLINEKLSVVVSSGITLNLGTLLEGNTNDDSMINIKDFAILAASYGKSSGVAGYDSRADFDLNGSINIKDFVLLAANYGKSSPIIVP